MRTVFVVGPDKKVKLTLTHPAAIGRNVDEVVRVLDALQLSAENAVSTPVNWTDGDDVIISPAISDDDAAARFPKGYRREALSALHTATQPLRRSRPAAHKGTLGARRDRGSR